MPLARTRHAPLQFAAVLAVGLGLPAAAFATGFVTKSAQSGQKIFLKHCANCHGTDATGHGPAAAALTTPPADLTQIKRRAGGTFPGPHVVDVITYGGSVPAHGNGDMPVWGKIFSVEGGQGKVGSFYSRRAVIALKRYLETIQQ